VERWVRNETDAQKAKSYRLRAARIKQLAKRMPDKRDQRALLGIATHFLQQADELELAPTLRENAGNSEGRSSSLRQVAALGSTVLDHCAID
jgi:hypothetical protein